VYSQKLTIISLILRVRSKINYLQIYDYITRRKRYGHMSYLKRGEKSAREAVSVISNWWSKRNAQSMIPYERPLSTQLNGNQLSGQQHCNVSQCRSIKEFAMNDAPVRVKAHFRSGAIVDPNLMLTFLRYRPLTLNPLNTKRRLLYLTFWQQSFTFKF
jgi:hypothetical protein